MAIEVIQIPDELLERAAAKEVPEHRSQDFGGA